MKLSVSNIAWENRRLGEHLGLLSDLGCDGVELAPSCIWPEPITAASYERSSLRRLIGDIGLEMVGFHALLYTRPDLQLFLDQKSSKATVEYLGELAYLCADLNGSRMILGSPRNRVRHGRSYEECLDWASDAIGSLAEICAPLGVVICIEPLGPDETEFIISASEGAELVRRVGHSNFRLHLDAKALISSGEDLSNILAEHGDLLHHFHVSDPGLSPPGMKGVDHTQYGRALRNSGYDRYVSIEMRRTDGDSKEVVTRSVAFVRQHYLESNTDGVRDG